MPVGIGYFLLQRWGVVADIEWGIGLDGDDEIRFYQDGLVVARHVGQDQGEHHRPWQPDGAYSRDVCHCDDDHTCFHCQAQAAYQRCRDQLAEQARRHDRDALVTGGREALRYLEDIEIVHVEGR